MERVFLIGKLNDSLEELNNYLAAYLNVQVCVDNVDLVKGMLKLNKPDIVVLNMNGLEAENLLLLVELKNICTEIPVLCLDSEMEPECFKDFLTTTDFQVLKHPIDKGELLEMIYETLHIDCDVDGMVIKKALGQRKCILLIDDSAIQLRALNEMLKDKYDVMMATSGSKALTLIGQRLPDLIFLDYDMPVCDGKMTLQMIREIEEAQEIPVIFLTGLNDTEHIRSVLDLHPAGYLIKPASKKVIYEALEKNLYRDEFIS